MTDDIAVLETVYAHFNARNIDGVLDALADDVDWAHAMDGGYVHGHCMNTPTDWRDALEGVLYANDRVVEDGAAPLATKDKGARRIEVVFELLALRTPGEAYQLAGESQARTLKRKMKKLGIAGPLFTK